MYAPLLWVHSWNRWALLAATIYFLIRCLSSLKKPWAEDQENFLRIYNILFLMQFALGLMLFLGSSPLVKSAIANPSLVFEDPVYSFWILRHGPTMIFALGIFHMGRAIARKHGNHQRVFAIVFAVVLLLIISAIPWSGLSYERPLFRWIF
jgi:hypothetical protein